MTPVQYIEVPVGELRPNSFNPNRVTADNEKKIRASIERNGIFKPIIVRQVANIRGYEIIGGEHRWDQAKALGYATVPIANLGEIDDARAKEICLIDNARYGADDTLTLSDILKDIGTADELQEFLPYGDTDLAAIFSAASIDLSSLNVPENNEILPELPPDGDSPATKPARTHTVMRFKVSNEDAERLTALIAKTQTAHDYRHEDQLTNAGDALIHLLSGSLGTAPAPAAVAIEDWGTMLAEIEKAQEQSE
ncbi:chromosome partitioning protein ParB [Paracoccus litorisediminis]|uniref:Chromosome partitioning protein ParB n=1 Tax=Paracoccus litorisediminis TaxID=2006130 RepID=A0A844HSK0_9RHOB|nr:chromosome partitioning protein ParB [Paracoccus litorisediminis]